MIGDPLKSGQVQVGSSFEKKRLFQINKEFFRGPN